MFFIHIRIYKNCRLTTPDHMVDHEWSVVEPRLSSYRYGCQMASFFNANTLVLVLMVVLVLIVVPVTTPGQVVDHDWLLVRLRLSLYRYGCQQTSFFNANTLVLVLWWFRLPLPTTWSTTTGHQ